MLDCVHSWDRQVTNEGKENIAVNYTVPRTNKSNHEIISEMYLTERYKGKLTVEQIDTAVKEIYPEYLI